MQRVGGREGGREGREGGREGGRDREREREREYLRLKGREIGGRHAIPVHASSSNVHMRRVAAQRQYLYVCTSKASKLSTGRREWRCRSARICQPRPTRRSKVGCLTYVHTYIVVHTHTQTHIHSSIGHIHSSMRTHI
jgi:hypothetical protein